LYDTHCEAKDLFREILEHMGYWKPIIRNAIDEEKPTVLSEIQELRKENASLRDSLQAVHEVVASLATEARELRGRNASLGDSLKEVMASLATEVRELRASRIPIPRERAGRPSTPPPRPLSSPPPASRPMAWSSTRGRDERGPMSLPPARPRKPKAKRRHDDSNVQHRAEGE